ncbi:hypothetical protein OSTOST_14260 [Ostertagia ostertagi]
MGKFVIKQAKNEQFYFNLKADNGQTILSSEMYTTKAPARMNAPKQERYERKTATNGKPYFNLKAGNGQVIGTSEMYENEAGRDNGVASVMKNAPDAAIIEE